MAFENKSNSKEICSQKQKNPNVFCRREFLYQTLKPVELSTESAMRNLQSIFKEVCEICTQQNGR